jgi:hypothetical protein
VTDSLELAVPARHGHPDFDFDFRVTRRLDRCLNNTARRKGSVRATASASTRSSGNGLCRRYGRVGKFERGEAFARRCHRGHYTEYKYREEGKE